MGLGKTTSTVIALLECGAEKVLVICPVFENNNKEK